MYMMIMLLTSHTTCTNRYLQAKKSNENRTKNKRCYPSK